MTEKAAIPLCLFIGKKQHNVRPRFVDIMVLITEHQEFLDSFLRFALSRSFQREASCVQLDLEFCPLTFMEIELFIQTVLPAPGLPAIPGKNVFCFFSVLSLKKRKSNVGGKQDLHCVHMTWHQVQQTKCGHRDAGVALFELHLLPTSLEDMMQHRIINSYN